MIRRMLSVGTLLAIAALFAVQPAEAKLKKVGQSGFKFLSNPVGARGMALGTAYMAMAEDASAIFYNPAGMARTQGRSLFFDATKSIADINYYAGALSMNMGDYGVFGVSTLFMDYGELIGTRRDPAGYVFTGDYSPTAFAIGISYARTMTDRFGFGGTVKWTRMDFGSAEAITEDSETGAITDSRMISHALNVPAFDVGVMYYTHLRGLQFGASFRNFSKEEEFISDDFSLPLELRFGMAVDMIDLMSLHGLGANHTATFSSDFQHSRDYSSRIHYGFEYWYRGALALRGGYKSNYDEEDLTYGAGLRGAVADYAFTFDYAYNDFGLFSSVHKFTVGLEF